MEPLTLTFVSVLFVLALYLVLSVRRDFQKRVEAGRRQRLPAGRMRRR